MGSTRKAQLDAMAEQATIDCYNDGEEVTGFFTMIGDNLVLPFETQVLGVSVLVEGVDLTEDDQIVAICRRGKHQQSIPILDLPLPTPPPEGADWIDAYRHWLR